MIKRLITLSESKTHKKEINNHEPRGCQPAENNAEQRAKQRKQQAATTEHRAQKQRNDDPGKRLKQYKRKKPKPGGHSLMAPPGPIPNPEVKHQHVDGSRTTGPARVDSRQGSIKAARRKPLRPFPLSRERSELSRGKAPLSREAQRNFHATAFTAFPQGVTSHPRSRDPSPLLVGLRRGRGLKRSS